MSKKPFYLIALVILTAFAASSWWRARRLEPTIVQHFQSTAETARATPADVNHSQVSESKIATKHAAIETESKDVVFGLSGLVELGQVPAGRFHDQLAKISPTARARALKQLGDTHVPLIDVNSLSVDRAGFLFYACDFALPAAGAESAQITRTARVR